MKKLLLGLIVACVGALNASATIVTFASSVDWDCTSYGAGCLAVGNQVTLQSSLILTFTPTNPSVNAPEAPANSVVSFGEIVATCANGADCSSEISLTGLAITLQIAQTAPFGGVAGQGAFTGNLTGSIGTISSTGLVVFSPLSFQLTDGTTIKVNYRLQQPIDPDGYALSAINNQNPTSLQGFVNVNAVPEPSSMVFVGTGLIGLAFLTRRLRK